MLYISLVQTSSKILTITTDWSNDDYYTGALIGEIMSIAPDMRIITLSNKIAFHNNNRASFVIKNSFRHFPAGTTHLCMVNSESFNNNNQFIVFEYEQHFFIVPDNGIISLITTNKPDVIYSIELEKHQPFSSLNTVTKAIKAIVENKLFTLNVAQNVARSTQFEPVWDKNSITGSILHVDSYDNLITNISKDLFIKIRQERQFAIYLQSLRQKVDRLVRSYNEAKEGELIAIFNSLDLLEIAMIGSCVARIYNLNPTDDIIIKFTDNSLILS